MKNPLNKELLKLTNGSIYFYSFKPNSKSVYYGITRQPAIRESRHCRTYGTGKLTVLLTFSRESLATAKQVETWVITEAKKDSSIKCLNKSSGTGLHGVTRTKTTIDRQLFTSCVGQIKDSQGHIFNSVKDAAEFHGISESRVSQCLWNPGSEIFSRNKRQLRYCGGRKTRVSFTFANLPVQNKKAA